MKRRRIKLLTVVWVDLCDVFSKLFVAIFDSAHLGCDVLKNIHRLTVEILL